jgi:hypothetical protein
MTPVKEGLGDPRVLVHVDLGEHPGAVALDREPLQHG